jgi:multidrug efflux system outer membrane protein
MKAIDARPLAGACVALAAGCALLACTVGPDYKRPSIDSPPQYRTPDAGVPVDAAILDHAWWQEWNDPVLVQLVSEALAANRDIAAASARVEQFYGILGTTRSALFPQVGAEFTAGRSRVTESGVPPAVVGFNPRSAYQADVFATWELDLFGRLRRLTEAARADLLAADEARKGVLLSVVTATASGYISLRDLDNRLLVAQRTVATRADALALFQKRFRGGVVSEIELNQAKSEYAAALTTVPQLEQSIAQQENALAVLLGRNPGSIARGAAIGDLAAPLVPAGLPSDLLERRPDLRQAERALMAANARIGAAKALYYPSIPLTAAFGSASSSLSDLFSGPARIWSYAGAITGPIFSAGGIAGQVLTAEGVQREALANYQKAVQAAFQDTDNALIGVMKTYEARDAQKTQVDALARYALLSRRKYEGGYTSYLEVLDAERSLFNAELAYSQAQGDALLQNVALVKALGGGWVDVADQGAPPPVVQAASTPRPYP